MSHRVTLICDNCGEEYILGENMDLPPYWLGVQVAVGNYDGEASGAELFLHLCGQECLSEYTEGEELRNKIAFIDKPADDEAEDLEEEES